MKSFFIGLMMLISSFGVSQTWVSDKSKSYQIVDGSWIYKESDYDANTFVVCGTDLIWVSDKIVRYGILDKTHTEVNVKYILQGKLDHILTMEVTDNDLILRFLAEDGNFYSIEFNIAKWYKKY